MYDVNPPDTEALLDTEMAAQAAQVAEHVIRTWRTRGWIGLNGQRERLPVAGRDWRGFPLHRYADVLAAELATRNSGKSHRRHGGPQQLDTLTGELRPVNWDALDRQSA